MNWVLRFIAGHRARTAAFEKELLTYTSFFSLLVIIFINVPAELIKPLRFLELHMIMNVIYASTCLITWALAKYKGVYIIKIFLILTYMTTILSWVIDDGIMGNVFIYVLKDILCALILLRKNERLIVVAFQTIVMTIVSFLDPLYVPKKYSDILSPLYSGYIIDYLIIIIVFYAIISVWSKAFDIERENLIIAIDKIKKSVNTDTLTKIPNRKAMFEELEKRFKSLREDTVQTFCVVVIDVDKFKLINDGGGGHAMGDRVLIEIARRLTILTPADSMVFRMGGEEFFLILDGVHLFEGKIICNQLREEISISPIEELTVTISLGVTEATHEDTEEIIIARADQAMYRAKQCGRNRVEAVI